MATTSRNDDTIDAVDRCLRVIEVLKANNGAGVTEIATELGWAKSTVHSHVRTLEANEYVIRQDGEYVLGFPFLELGEYVKTREPAFSAVEPKMEELAEQTGKRVQFIKNEHGYAVYVRIAEGQQAVSTGSRHGRRRPMLHASAAGKAILAHLPESDVEAILDRRGMTEFTQNTITDREMLFAELADIRERGYAFNREEHISGLRAVAAPVHNGGRVVGSLSVAGAARRMQGEYFEEELPELLLGIVNEVELDLEYS
jgi:DNA-binding IclR family transcriptional regulator